MIILTQVTKLCYLKSFQHYSIIVIIVQVPSRIFVSDGCYPCAFQSWPTAASTSNGIAFTNSSSLPLNTRRSASGSTFWKQNKMASKGASIDGSRFFAQVLPIIRGGNHRWAHSWSTTTHYTYLLVTVHSLSPSASKITRSLNTNLPRTAHVAPHVN